jgi:hypothetical protein
MRCSVIYQAGHLRCDRQCRKGGDMSNATVVWLLAGFETGIPMQPATGALYHSRGRGK